MTSSVAAGRLHADKTGRSAAVTGWGVACAASATAPHRRPDHRRNPMRVLATRPQRLALGIAVLTAAALGTVSASAAQASGTSTTTKPHHTRTAFAVAYHPTSNAPADLNTANDDF